MRKEKNLLLPLAKNDRIFLFTGTPWEWLLCWLIAANLIAFFLFGLDKWKAKRKARRIRERTLFLWAFLGGSAGAILGMRVFHHKTRKPRFRVGLPLILLAQILLPLWLWLRYRGAP